MQSRMENPLMVIPDALQALMALDKTTHDAGISQVTKELVHLRASQINGCSMCVDMHARELKKAGESDERIFSVAAWRHTPYYTDAERAALALTEVLTRIADREDPVSDELWDETAKHYDEMALSVLIFQIGLINAINRVNASVRQVAGSWHRPA